MIGRTLGGYRIVEQIGMGGMATVYKAYDPKTDRYIALKTIPQHYAQDETFRARFEREARAIARLEHIHILPVFAYGEEEGIAYMAMRYMDTGTLTELMRRGPMPFDEASRIISQIASALDYAHNRGIIHRDVKPSNVLMDDAGNSYLTDFGIAKIVEGTLDLTGDNILGTPQYMSPEQCRGVKDLTPATDQYSLGVILYEMVTGRTPYQAETPLAVIHMQLMDAPLPTPHSLRRDLPEAAEQVIFKALAREPEQRYPSCGAMAAAFAQAINAGQSAATVEHQETEPATAVGIQQTTHSPMPDHDTAVLPRPQRRTPLWVFGVVVLVIAAVIVGGLASGIIPQGGTTPTEVAGDTVQTPTVSASETPLPPTDAPAPPTPSPVEIQESGILFQEDFEDRVVQGDFSTTADLNIIADETGNYVLDYDNTTSNENAYADFGSQSWEDNLVVEYRVRILEYSGDFPIASMYFHRHPDPCCSYYVVTMNPQWTDVFLEYSLENSPYRSLGSHTIDVSTNEWYTFRVVTSGERIEVFINETPAISINSLPIEQQGPAELGVAPGAHVQFDDVRVTAVGDAVTDASVPTEIPESAVLFEEDFEDRIVQGEFSTSNLNIIADETGNYVIDFDNTRSNNYAEAEFGSQSWGGNMVFEYRIRILEYTDDLLSASMQFHHNGNPCCSYYEVALSPQWSAVSLAYALADGQYRTLGTHSMNVSTNEWYAIRIITRGEGIEVFINETPAISINSIPFEQRGSAYLTVPPGAHVQFDDVRVTALGDTLSGTSTR